MTTTPAQMTGLEQLLALKNGPKDFAGIGATMGFRPFLFEEGRAIFESEPDERVYNPIGTVHGGFAATLLDSALGCAVHSVLKAGQGYTTLDLQVAYHRAMTKDTGRVEAEGKVITIGRRVAYTEGRITDAKGRVYATATSTLLVFER